MMPPSFVIHSTLQMFAELQLIRTFSALGIELCTWWIIISLICSVFTMYQKALLSIDCHITFNRLSHWNHSVTLWNGQITIILLRRKIWRLRGNKTYDCMCVYKPCRMENSGKLFSKTAPCMICTCTLRSQACEFKPYTVKILTPFTIFLHYTKIFILFQLHNKGLDEAHSILMSMTLQKNISLEKLLPIFLWNL